MIEEGASDLHISVDAPPVLRLHGGLTRLNRPGLSADDTQALASAMASPGQLARVKTDGTVDFGFSYAEQRFRVSLYLERGAMAMAVRLLPQYMLSLDEIGIPESVRPLLESRQGFILFTGPTGSGKTTSLASMLNHINQSSDRHILTIEDPIEYIHKHKTGIIHQREVGSDVPSFVEGIRRGMRQDPDVLLVGEMRDLETMRAAVTAAETGHLVFSTLHTTGAARTVDRIIDSFPPDHQNQVRMQLSSTLRAVVSQLLLPRCDGKGRVAAFEVMINTHAVAALIREQKTYQITTEVQTGTSHGMLSLDQSLVDLHTRGLISYDQVLHNANDKELVAQLAVKAAPKKGFAGLFSGS